MKTVFLVFVLAVILGAGIFGAETSKESGEPPLFTWDLSWAGSWQKSIKTPEGELPSGNDLFPGGTLFNRGNLSLGLPGLDLSFRFLVTDKRTLPPETDDNKAGFNPGLGIYHDGTGSRFLFGIQNEYGLPARINHVWLRSVPFMESRGPSSRDLKTEPAASDNNESYLYLSLPQNKIFGAFASAALDNKMNTAFGGGMGLRGEDTEFRLEGFYTKNELPPRKAAAWFSPSPPLPERDFSVYALGLLFNSPPAAFGADWAWSETFAWGRGVYGSAAIRLGNKPWRFSIAGDGTGGRFADRHGAAPGPGFRVAAKGEHFRPRSGLLRIQGTFRSPDIEEPFNRGNVSVYFRPKAPTAAERRTGIFHFTRASLSLGRDARVPEKTGDSLNALAGFNLGFLNGVFSCTLRSFSRLDTDKGNQLLFEPAFFETFESFKLSGELGLRFGNWKPGFFDLKLRLGYTIRADNEPLWEPSLNCSYRPGRWGRLGLKIAYTDFPQKWNYALSWRFEGSFPN